MLGVITNRFLLLRKENRNILLFYLLTATTNAWFLASNWIYFWTRYMTFGQLGLIDGLAFGFALLLEIPTGAIADIFGKKKTIMAAFLALSVGSMTIATANSLSTIFIGWMITSLGLALYSGAAEALAYDTLVDLKQEGRYEEVISRSNSVGLYVGAITTFLGGFLFVVNFRLPHILWSTAYFIGLIFTFFLIEPKIDTVKFSLANYVNQLVIGIKELLQPKLRFLSVFVFIILGIYFMYSWGFLRPAIADSFGFKAEAQGIILPLLSITSALLLGLIPLMRKKFSDIGGLVIMAVIMGVSFVLASLPLGYLGLVALILAAIMGELAYPWISIIVNKDISSKYRATTLSTIALITKIPYVLLAIVAGKAVENGLLKTFNLSIALIILLGIIFGLVVNYFSTKNQPQIKVMKSIT